MHRSARSEFRMYPSVPLFIQVLVYRALLYSIRTRRYDYPCAFGFDFPDQLRVVVGFVGNQRLGRVALDQVPGLRVIITLPSRQDKP